MRNQGLISVHFVIGRINRRGNLPFRSKLMNTYNIVVTVNRRNGYMELATLTTGGISAMVARKSQMSPLRTGGISADRKHHD